MRRLVLLCLAAAAATNAYELVIQEVKLTGGRIINSDEMNCTNIEYLHVSGNAYQIDCHDVLSPTDQTVESRILTYLAAPITTNDKWISFVIGLSGGATNVTFSITPQMNKVGQRQSLTSGDVKYNEPATSTVAPSTTATLPPTTGPPTCDKDGKPEGCTPPAETNTAVQVPAKAVKKTIDRLQPVEGARAEAATAAAAAPVDSALPPAMRIRGQGPVRPPVRQSPSEYTLVKITEPIVAEEDEEKLRVKREGEAPPPTIDSTTLNIEVSFAILDEAGNPAAVWAAVIEGIILIVLVGLCFWFFFWAPRARAAASAAQDPYKEGPSYSVSYANSSYNNQRIDAFQNPPTPAAPPRPANSAYMEDYITDNIGAMSASGGNGQSAAPAAAPAASASAFEPRHQRFDSSGLVTVNLS